LADETPTNSILFAPEPTVKEYVIDAALEVTCWLLALSKAIDIHSPYAVAMQRHLLVMVFQTKPTSRRVETTVVVGSATVLASKLVPHVIARAVPLSVIASHKVWFSVGVPDRLVVKLVIAAANAVIE